MFKFLKMELKEIIVFVALPCLKQGEVEHLFKQEYLDLIPNGIFGDGDFGYTVEWYGAAFI